MTPKPKAMDPDRFQMRDLKRRLTASERYQERTDARIQRMQLAFNRRIKFVESFLEPFVKENTEQE